MAPETNCATLRRLPCIKTTWQRHFSPGEEVPAELLPVVFHDLFHALFPGGQDGHPRQHRPQAVFLPDVVRAWEVGGGAE